MPGTALGAGATSMNKTNKIASLGIYILLWRETKRAHDDKQYETKSSWTRECKVSEIGSYFI